MKFLSHKYREQGSENLKDDKIDHSLFWSNISVVLGTLLLTIIFLYLSHSSGHI